MIKSSVDSCIDTRISSGSNTRVTCTFLICWLSIFSFMTRSAIEMSLHYYILNSEHLVIQSSRISFLAVSIVSRKNSIGCCLSLSHSVHICGHNMFLDIILWNLGLGSFKVIFKNWTLSPPKRPAKFTPMLLLFRYGCQYYCNMLKVSLVFD